MSIHKQYASKYARCITFANRQFLSRTKFCNPNCRIPATVCGFMQRVIRVAFTPDTTSAAVRWVKPGFSRGLAAGTFCMDAAFPRCTTGGGRRLALDRQAAQTEAGHDRSPAARRQKQLVSEQCQSCDRAVSELCQSSISCCRDCAMCVMLDLASAMAQHYGVSLVWCLLRQDKARISNFKVP